ncbi:sterol desaturase family protein [Woodsholea maritima]|uniref:sterol desaturase family protein n=1 Tax=Woodsholea maritima TaxID=240237 RepID=UPI00037F4EA3|nr:sterol desaturase family protein [Woodsholea maritima]
MGEQASTIWLVATYILLIAMEFATGLHKAKGKTLSDWAIDLIAITQLAIIIKPLAIVIAFTLMSVALPHFAGALAAMPAWIAFFMVFIPDDFLHYWYHRVAHERDWMWPMHRTHHTAERYQTTIAFRESFVWFLFMPGFWWMGIMTYLGLGPMVVLATLIVGLHNLYIHTGLTADCALYRHPIGRKIMAGVESLFNTPSLHRGHHGVGENSVPFGNYGQTLALWDHLFGTATRLHDALPERYGTIKNEQLTWWQQLWWPVFGPFQPSKDDARHHGGPTDVIDPRIEVQDIKNSARF